MFSIDYLVDFYFPHGLESYVSHVAATPVNTHLKICHACIFHIILSWYTLNISIYIYRYRYIDIFIYLFIYL